MPNTPKGLLDFEKPLTELFKKVDELTRLSKHGKIDLQTEIEALQKRIEMRRKEIFANLDPDADSIYRKACPEAFHT